MKIICLDPGHGPGCANGSPDGTYKEHEFAWDMAARLKKLLEGQGLTVVLTRTETGYPSLLQRAAASNNAKADLFLSLHSNAAGSGGWSNPRGLELYTYQAGEGESQNVAAKAILKRLEGAGVVTRLPALRHLPYTVLTATYAPAVLMEYGFHTNKGDVELLSDGGYRDKLALATARGVCDYFGKEWKDMEEKKWYHDAQKWAVEMGLTDGTRPEEVCTRAEEWTMLKRLYEAMKAGK